MCVKKRGRFGTQLVSFRFITFERKIVAKKFVPNIRIGNVSYRDILQSLSILHIFLVYIKSVAEVSKFALRTVFHAQNTLP